jgi:hypothetical protein
MNRGRIQAQGGGTEKSDAWAIETDHCKSMGIDSVDNLEERLDNVEYRIRESALQKCRRAILNAPNCGISAPMKKSYPADRRRDSSIRIDIEINSGIAFMDNPPNEEGNEA